MLEHLQGVPSRIAELKRKLAASEGKPEYRERVTAIKADIARLEGVSQKTTDLKEFLASNQPLASEPDQG